MKVCQINCVYGIGSTGKIVQDIHKELKSRNIESIVCYGRGPKTTEPDVYKVCGEIYSKINNVWSRLSGIKYGGLKFSTWKLERIIEHEKPDIVHLHCINGYFVNIYKIINYLKKNNINTVVSLHAEFMYTANCGHAFDCEKWKTGCGHCHVWKLETKSLWFDRTNKSWQMMKQAFDGFDKRLIVTSVSPWLMKRAKSSPILAGKKHAVVMNGLNTEVFHIKDIEKLRNMYGYEKETKIIFHATPSFTDNPTDIKGGSFLVELAKRMPNVIIIIAGPHNNISVPGNIKLLGRITDQNVLSDYYAMADLTVITSKKETFSMVCAESLSCGTPVVGFFAGGPESIALQEYSDWAEYGNIDQLAQLADKWIHKSFDRKKCSQNSRRIYSRYVMTNAYINIYKMLIKNA